MTLSMLEKYVAVHKQGFMPIFVNDNLDVSVLASLCIEAGFQAIELTCRRPNVVEELKRIKAEFPKLIVLVGSLVDENSELFPYIRRRRGQFPSMEQLADIGADGFVAQLPFSGKTIETYADRCIMIPGVETLREAVDAIDAGAHFVKFCSMPPERIRHINNAATHHLFPLFYTGGVTAERLPDYLRNGASVIGSGWDLILGENYGAMKETFDDRQALNDLLVFKRAVIETRADEIEGYDRLLRAEPEQYLSSLQHYYPFSVREVIRK